MKSLLKFFSRLAVFDRALLVSVGSLTAGITVWLRSPDAQLYLLMGVGLSVSIASFASARLIKASAARDTNRVTIPKGVHLLDAICNFCSKETKEVVECLIGDMKKQTRRLYAEGWSKRYIECVALYRAFSHCIVPLVWDKAKRIMKPSKTKDIAGKH